MVRRHALPVIIPFILFAMCLTHSQAGEKPIKNRTNPPLLIEHDLPKPEPVNTESSTSKSDLQKAESLPRRSWRGRRSTKPRESNRQPEEKPMPPAVAKTTESKEELAPTTGKAEEPSSDSAAQSTEPAMDTPEAMHWRDEYREPPTPQAVIDYQLKLEARLLERYNNLPEYGGMVGRVYVILAKPFDVSLDGSMIRAEFDQLVYDHWGKRLPKLEQEYFVVTFGAGGVQQVRSDPSIRVGLDMEKTFSERAPLPADPFRGIEDPQTFKQTPTQTMPEWWRPDFE